jgi:hypothetical protein
MRYAPFLSALVVGSQLVAQTQPVVILPRKDPLKVLSDRLGEIAERQRAEREKLLLEQQRKAEIKLQLFAEHIRGLSPEEVGEIVRRTQDPVIREAYAPFLDFVSEPPAPAAAVPGLVMVGNNRATIVSTLGEPPDSRFDEAGKEILLYRMSESTSVAVILASNIAEQIVIVSIADPPSRKN